VRIVFFGSPAFALPALQALLDANREVVAVVTQPDRPAGRGHATSQPPVKSLALEHGLPVLQPENVSTPESVEVLRAFRPDVFVVAAYGQILRQRLLDVPARGSLNVHASLLPRHRGASPIAAAILAGDEVTGVTVMEVVRALDAGPMVSRVEVPISPFDTTGTLEPQLASAGGRLLDDTLDAWYSGSLLGQPQDDALATYAPQLSRGDARLDWSLPAVDLWRRVRAFHPWPVAFTTFRGEELRILDAWPLPGSGSDVPGTVLPPETLPSEASVDASTRRSRGFPYSASGAEETFSVQTGTGGLAIRQLQRPGRRPVSGMEFLRGQRDFVGAKLGE
jgi:methionyl-tRNA formyltransferase